MQNIKSLVDSRQEVNHKSTSRLSTPSKEAIYLAEKIGDPEMGLRFVDKVIDTLGIAEARSIAEWAVNIKSRQNGHAGKLFVSVASKAINKATGGV